MSRKPNQNFPGESECDLGLVSGIEYGNTHVCLNCNGNGCKPKRSNRAVRARRTEQLLALSGSTVFTDQKGRAVFVNLETGTAHVAE